MAVYEKCAPGSKNPNYELIHITSHNGYVIGGNKIPPAEVYPSDTQWGVHGYISRSGLKLLRKNSVSHPDKDKLLQYNGKSE